MYHKIRTQGLRAQRQMGPTAEPTLGLNGILKLGHPWNLVCLLQPPYLAAISSVGLWGPNLEFKKYHDVVTPYLASVSILSSPPIAKYSLLSSSNNFSPSHGFCMSMCNTGVHLPNSTTISFLSSFDALHSRTCLDLP